jgi:hypothetical protein
MRVVSNSCARKRREPVRRELSGGDWENLPYGNQCIPGYEELPLRNGIKLALRFQLLLATGITSWLLLQAGS